MPSGWITLALSAAMQVGTVSPSETPNYPPLRNAFSQGGFEGQYEQRYPFDTQQNWVHGYHQEIPAYGGHVFFRPYNYKDVLSQSQTAAGWGLSPTMPYSQQFWHRYHDQATMLKLSRSEHQRPVAPASAAPAMGPVYAAQPQVMPVGAWTGPAVPYGWAPAAPAYYPAPAAPAYYPAPAAAPVYYLPPQQ